jgi:uncharacterized protein YfaQ (DUF2300 family)
MALKLKRVLVELRLQSALAAKVLMANGRPMSQATLAQIVNHDDWRTTEREIITSQVKAFCSHMVPTTAISAICLKKKNPKNPKQCHPPRQALLRKSTHPQTKGARRYATTKTHINCRCPP